MTRNAQTDEIDCFLRTGEYDPLFRRWPGSDLLDSIVRGSDALRDALLNEVRRRQGDSVPGLPVAPVGHELAAFTRAKVEPMVRGLFRRNECGPVLTLLEASVVFLTRESIEPAIRQADLDTAWEIANVYLSSLGAERLDPSVPRHVGLSVETTCYVSTEYFSEESPFADFVVHEAAHVFHQTKRRSVGLPETKHREWLLPIGFQKRETFAYACEAYSCILQQAQAVAKRRSLFGQLQRLPPPPDERVEPNEYFSILADAVESRNGWKVILERCSVRDS